LGFVSYNRAYYKAKLNEYESKYNDKAPQSVVHEAKVLLKILDDIHDEGYTYAYDTFSAEFDCIKRLKAFITKNGETPFEVKNYSLLRQPHYPEKQFDLSVYLAALEERMYGGGPVMPETPGLFYDISGYAKSVFSAARSDTAYVFLLRDTLLPYLAFKKWDTAGRLALYPFLIGRRYLSFFSEQSGGGTGDIGPSGDSEALYDALHEAIFSALSKEPADLGELRSYVRVLLQNELQRFPGVIDSISNLLGSIPQKKIMVIESGFIGTIPLLLSCLDDRVDFTLFTTIPCFYNAYKGKYYTNAFERIRLFETIQCQDALFKLSSVDGSRFLVSETDNNEIKEHASLELRTWNAFI
jgi:hypothetical protein